MTHEDIADAPASPAQIAQQIRKAAAAASSGANKCGASTKRAANVEKPRPVVEEFMRQVCGTDPAIGRKGVMVARPRRKLQASRAAPAGRRRAAVAAMQRGDGGCEAEAETGTRLGAAGLEPDKALDRVRAVGFGNSRSMVGHAEQHLVALARAPRSGSAPWQHPASSGSTPGRPAVFDGVFDQVGERLADQFAVAVHRCRLGLHRKRQTVVLGQRLVQFVDAAGESAASKSSILSRACPNPRARSSERVEGADQAVGFLDRALQRRAVFGSRCRFASASSARLRSRVSGVFRSCAMLSETSFRPSISASMRSSMALRFSARRSSSSPLRPTGKPAGQIASHDALGRAGHGIDPPQHAPRDENAAAEPEHHHDENRPLRRVGNDTEQPSTLLEVASDQEAKTAGDSLTRTSAR